MDRVWLTKHADWIAVALLILAILRSAATFTVLAATTDEPVHVSAGVELLEQHRYTLQPVNPPMPRVILAFPLWARGLNFNPADDISTYLGALFYSGGHYKTNLFLARIGNLLFFAVAALATWWWGRRELGRTGGLLTMLLFTTQPLVLGFAGIANHDMPAVAGVAISLLAFSKWLDEPTRRNAAILGIAFGLSVGWKFSDLLFVPGACGAVYIARLILDARARAAFVPALKLIPICAVVAAITLWATYGFTFGSIENSSIRAGAPADLVAKWFGRSTPLPAPHLLVGLAELIVFEKEGFDSYALGRWTRTGWWWYFPLAIALKTTIGSLLLSLAGLILKWREASRRTAYIGYLAAAAAMLAIALPSVINLGVRYVLPIYVPLSVAAAAVILEAIENGARVRRVVVTILLVWHCVASIAAHPDYFPYFNELAGRDPSRYLIDSNLDWGQDALRLENVASREHFDRIGLSIVGMHDFDALGFPPSYPLDPKTPARGWIAVSDHIYHRDVKDGGWWWLKDRKYRRIGKSIRLYHVE